MRLVVIGCLCIGTLAATGCANGGSPTSPSTTAAATAVAAAAPGAERSARATVLLLTKICDTGDHCRVNSSSSGPIPVNSDINYFGPLLDARTTSRIVVTTPAGDTAEGNCSLSYKKWEGTCVITHGTGNLAGLHVNAKVSSDFSNPDVPVFTWEGPYHFAP